VRDDGEHREPDRATDERVHETRGHDAPPTVGTVATSTADAAACETTSGPPPSRIVADIASSTTSATCAGPRPIAARRASPIAIPTPTPSTSSTARVVRRPGASPSAITAAIGAKKPLRWWSTSCATYQAIPAAAAICRSATPLARSARTRASRCRASDGERRIGAS
jgi:hypothetical protein